jgi:hypothetical protein
MHADHQVLPETIQKKGSSLASRNQVEWNTYSNIEVTFMFAHKMEIDCL